MRIDPQKEVNTMAIRYKHTETGEFANKEAWRWVAVYADGSNLRQFDLDPDGAHFHRFDEIDIENIVELIMEHDTLAPVRIFIPNDAKPIHFYRNYVLKNDTERLKHYCVGFELGKFRYCCVITDKNEVIITDDFDNIKMP